MSEQDEVEGEKIKKLQPYAQNYRQVRKTRTKGRTHQLDAQYQMVSHENIYTNNIGNAQVIFQKLYVYSIMHMHAITISERSGLGFEDNCGEFGKKKEKEEIL